MRTRDLAAHVALVSTLALGCNSSGSGAQERWVQTDNAQVQIDWDLVAKAYKQAEGPEDFEKRVNEIYTGPETISVSVHDLDAKTQEVTGFFDNNADGLVEEPEKVFTIRRDIKSEDSGTYQIQGYNRYHGYHSPMMSFVTGALLGGMLSRAFSPGYVPMYTTPYVTSPSRRSYLTSQRPASSRTRPSTSYKSSKTGRTYGRPSSTPRRSSFGRRGGSFGLGDRGGRKVIRAT